jgi:hypothetical protein
MLRPNLKVDIYSLSHIYILICKTALPPHSTTTFACETLFEKPQLSYCLLRPSRKASSNNTSKFIDHLLQQYQYFKQATIDLADRTFFHLLRLNRKVSGDIFWNFFSIAVDE